MYACGWGKEAAVGERERGGRRREWEKERERHKGKVFNFKWLLASRCLVNLGNLNKSTSWM